MNDFEHLTRWVLSADGCWVFVVACGGAAWRWRAATLTKCARTQHACACVLVLNCCRASVLGLDCVYIQSCCKKAVVLVTATVRLTWCCGYLLMAVGGGCRALIYQSVALGVQHIVVWQCHATSLECGLLLLLFLWVWPPHTTRLATQVYVSGGSTPPLSCSIQGFDTRCKTITGPALSQAFCCFCEAVYRVAGYARYCCV